MAICTVLLSVQGGRLPQKTRVRESTRSCLRPRTHTESFMVVYVKNLTSLFTHFKNKILHIYMVEVSSSHEVGWPQPFNGLMHSSVSGLISLLLPEVAIHIYKRAPFLPFFLNKWISNLFCAFYRGDQAHLGSSVLFLKGELVGDAHMNILINKLPSL